MRYFEAVTVYNISKLIRDFSMFKIAILV